MQISPTTPRFESQRNDPELAARPTNRLMLAVLEEALVTFEAGLHSTDLRQRHLTWEVERWIASTDGDPLFSFENICGSLSIDPGYLRDGLRHDGRATPVNWNLLRQPDVGALILEQAIVGIDPLPTRSVGELDTIDGIVGTPVVSVGYGLNWTQVVRHEADTRSRAADRPRRR